MTYLIAFVNALSRYIVMARLAHLSRAMLGALIMDSNKKDPTYTTLGALRGTPEPLVKHRPFAALRRCRLRVNAQKKGEARHGILSEIGFTQMMC